MKVTADGTGVPRSPRPRSDCSVTGALRRDPRRLTGNLTKRRWRISLRVIGLERPNNMATTGQVFRRIAYIALCWIAAWANHHMLAGDITGPTSAGWTPAEIPGIDGLVDAAGTEVKRSGKASRIAAFDDVRDVMAHASEWRWYSRDNGILLAIPIRERLGITAKAEGEKALADVVRRLINQAGWGNPPVQVLLVRHEVPQQAMTPCQPCREVTPTSPCGFE